MKKLFAALLCMMILPLCVGCFSFGFGSMGSSSQDGVGPALRVEGDHTVVKAEDSSPSAAYDLQVRRLVFAASKDVTLTIKPADGAPRVEVDCAKGFLDRGLTAEIGDGKITVQSDNRGTFLTDSFHITVYAPCKSIRIDGAYQLDADASHVDSFRLEVNGAADGKIYNLSVGDASCDIRGAGKLALSGQATKLSCTVNGAAALDAKGLPAQTVGVTINGAGSASVNATKTLDATINGAGSVVYYGAPSIVNPRINGVGSVQAGK